MQWSSRCKVVRELLPHLSLLPCGGAAGMLELLMTSLGPVSDPAGSSTPCAADQRVSLAQCPANRKMVYSLSKSTFLK